MPTLADMAFQREGNNKWVSRSPFKVVPATHPLTVSKYYKVRMDDGRVYEGAFTNYCYVKESLDGALCRVYLEFDISLGHIALEEVDVAGLVQTSPNVAMPPRPSVIKEADGTKTVKKKKAAKKTTAKK
jgi:hypothetical protein